MPMISRNRIATSYRAPAVERGLNWRTHDSDRIRPARLAGVRDGERIADCLRPRCGGGLVFNTAWLRQWQRQWQWQ